MDSTDYLRGVTGESLLTIRHRYLRISDRNLCAAILIDYFVSETTRRRLYSDFYYKKSRSLSEYEPWIKLTVQNIARDLYGLFPIDEVINALNLLLEKAYLSFCKLETNQEGEQIYGFFVQMDTIREASGFGVSQPAASPAEESPVEQPEVEISAPESEMDPQEQPVPQRRYSEAKRVAYHLKRAEAMALPATLTLEQWMGTLEFFDWKCAYCGVNHYTVFEHFVPLFHGGGTTSYNCVPACYRCNGRKTDLHPSVFESKFPREVIERIKQYFANALSNENVEEG